LNLVLIEVKSFRWFQIAFSPETLILVTFFVVCNVVNSCSCNFCFLLSATADVARQPKVDAAEDFCSSCRQPPNGRPGVGDVARLVNAWKQLHVCLRDGQSLAWLMDYVTAWRANLHHELDANNLSQEFRAGYCSSKFLMFHCCFVV
jgi:hypothetical protein